MNLNHLQVFIAVYETKSFSKAAEVLCVEQSSISRIIRRLESELSCCLFIRSRRAIEPTEAAMVLYENSLRIRDIVKRTSTGIKDKKEIISVGCTSTIGTLIVPEMVARYNKDTPSSRIHTLIDSQDRILEMLQTGIVDFALVEEGLFYHRDLHYKKIGGDRLIPIFSGESDWNKEQLCFGDFAQFPMVTCELGSSGRKHLENLFAKHGVELIPVVECNTELAIMECVRYGLGVSLIPEAYAKHYIEGGLLKTCSITDEDLTRGYYLVTKSRNNQSGASKILIQRIVDHISQDGKME